MIWRIIRILTLILATIESEDDRAFLRTLYEENYEAMLRKAKSILFDEAAAEDVVQDTFVYFAKNLDKLYRVSCNILPFYVVMCAKRKCLDYIKQQKVNSNHIAGSIDSDEYPYELPDKGSSVEEQALLNIDVESVQKAFAFLPESQKDVLRYKYLLDMKDEEIAKLLGVKKATVRSYLMRARQAVYEICKEKGYV